MAPSDQVKALVDEMPKADERGMYCHVVIRELPPEKGKRQVETQPIDKAKIDKAIDAIQKGGRASVLGIVDMLVEPGAGEDYKARYALHCLAVRVCQMKKATGDDKPRREFAEAVASALGAGRPKAVRAYLAQELQVAGGQEAVAALGKLLTDEEACDPAARALLSIGGAAVEQFRAALPAAKGYCRLAVVQALGVMRDAASVPALQAALKEPDREVRMAAGWGLARIGDASSADLLMKAADAEPGWERIQAVKACLMLAENLRAAGKKAEAVKIYTYLRDSRKDKSEQYVREAAEAALAAVK
ncbi:MAG: hypothetical protein FJ288_17420 [Planctomycetes bacterium]|nr:hypothetical protein [Planctomycetota bacterium]